MPVPFRLRFTPEALEGLKDLPLELKKVSERVLSDIANNPQKGKRLSGKWKGIQSVRITRRYRVLYLVKHTEREIVVLDVKHRKEAYD